jgi:Ulp1 family protease
MVYGDEARTLSKQAVNEIDCSETKILERYMDLSSHKRFEVSVKMKSCIRYTRTNILIQRQVEWTQYRNGSLSHLNKDFKRMFQRKKASRKTTKQVRGQGCSLPAPCTTLDVGCTK